MWLPYSVLCAPFGAVLNLIGMPSCAEHSHVAPVVLEQLGRPVNQADGVPYIPPAANGGSQLDSSAGLGEPLNIIISALSSAEVLSTKGIENFARSIGFSTECLGIHIGNPQTANLGDGLGWQNETAVLRYDFDNAMDGSCLESFLGGNHFRFWRQATTGAYFLAVSVEQWAGKNHNIVPDGYDIGRDSLMVRATGNTQYAGNQYTTSSYFVTGLLQPGTQGINHNISIDGRVGVLTVTKTK